jgi:hypothetical protein
VEPIEVAALEGGALDHIGRNERPERPERPTDARAVNESIDFAPARTLITGGIYARPDVRHARVASDFFDNARAVPSSNSIARARHANFIFNQKPKQNKKD